MESKIRKYVWIGFCTLVILFLLVIQFLYLGFDKSGLSVVNVGYILSFITAIAYALKSNKVIFYFCVLASLFILIYGYFFSSFFG